MTKSSRIMALYDGVRTTTEIAEIVGCCTAYVRTVARQRKGKQSTGDKRYIKKRCADAGPNEHQWSWHRRSAAARSAQRAYVRVRYYGGSKEDARAAYATARDEARAREGNECSKTR